MYSSFEKEQKLFEGWRKYTKEDSQSVLNEQSLTQLSPGDPKARDSHWVQTDLDDAIASYNRLGAELGQGARKNPKFRKFARNIRALRKEMYQLGFKPGNPEVAILENDPEYKNVVTARNTALSDQRRKLAQTGIKTPVTSSAGSAVGGPSLAPSPPGSRQPTQDVETPVTSSADLPVTSSVPGEMKKRRPPVPA